MTLPVIIDAVVVIILVAFVVYGAKRGLLQALTGLLVVVVALVGAGMVAATFSAPVAKLVSPIVEEKITERVEEALAERDVQTQTGEADIQDLLALLGIDEDVRGTLSEKAQKSVRETGASIVAAVVESLVYSIVHSLLFVLAFLVLVLLLRVLVGAMGIVMKLPGLHGLNALGGGLLGLVEGALVLFLAVWAARRLGVSFEAGPLAETHILRIFTTNTPLGLLSFL